MRVLITNDDGPPCEKASPYILPYIETLQKCTDWELVICVPHVQRSWIGKAHLVTQPNVHREERKYKETGDLVWNILDCTPASCASIGLSFLGEFDLVLSGPNVGRNTSAAYIMSSGTVGAAMEGAVSGVKSIALSYSYTYTVHPREDIIKASEFSAKIIKHLMDNWIDNVQLYSINVPLYDELSEKTPVKYTHIFNNAWGKMYKQLDTHNYKWGPDYEFCDETVHKAGHICPHTNELSDAWAVMHNEITITPMRSVFHCVSTDDHIDLAKL